MRILKMVNNRFYSHFDKDTKMLFILRYGDRGVYGAGKAWYLSVTYADTKQTIATFTVVNDNHNCYKEDYLGKLWNTSDVMREADEMVYRMLKNT